MAGREPYSSKSRTALVLTGTGTAGAYHAGVLKALSEAGVRIDLVAGLGIGATGACFAAIDGGEPLWRGDGLWRQPGVARAYPWRTVLTRLAWLGAAALALVAVPIAVLALGIVVFPVAFLLRLASLSASNSLADGYAAFVHNAFLPDRLPSYLADVALILMLGGLGMAALAAWGERSLGPHRELGRFWWRAFAAPFSVRQAVDYWRGALWRLISGGAKVAQPDAVQLSRRYSELLTDNLGQPGFREFLAVVHDIDARRDLVFALLAEPYRSAFFGRKRRTAAWADRANETLDLAGADRDHLADMLAASLCLPVGTTPWPLTFAAENYWRGETHRLSCRPGALVRVLEEVLAAGADQVILVSATPAPTEAHTLPAVRLDARGRFSEWLVSGDTAAMRDALAARMDQFRNLHVIRPLHNPVGPLDFRGAYDTRSHRTVPFAELLDVGYADAHRQFIEPVIGAAEASV